ncbi:MAG: hypothetical protein EP341_01255, partial [Sphingomonadales bacterium]
MHKRFLTLALAILAGLAAQPASSQDTNMVEWAGFTVSSNTGPDRVRVEQYDGAEALVVARATAMLEGVEFSEGVIEFDLAFEDKFGFGGLLWHAAGRDTEYFYVRQHKSGQPDAGQYTPVRKGLTS